MIQPRSRIRWRSLMSLGGGLAMVVSAGTGSGTGAGVEAGIYKKEESVSRFLIGIQEPRE
jgi:hypothetical protein